MGLHDRAVAEVMQREVVTLDAEDRLDFADDVMSLGRVRHMPVLEDGRLVGIVSNRDLLAASLSKSLEFDRRERRSFLRSVDVSDVMTRDVVHVGSDTTLREAAALLSTHQVGCLPVVEGGDRLVGLLTEVDLLRVAYLGDDTARELERAGGQATGLLERLEGEFDSIRQMRDELRVQLHLGGAEAKERFEGLEKKFREAESRVRLVTQEAEEPLHELGDVLQAVLTEIRQGYRQIRDAL